MAVHNMIESHKYQLSEAFITDCKPEHKMLNKTRWDAQLEFKTEKHIFLKLLTIVQIKASSY